jgi:hypothetical protein
MMWWIVLTLNLLQFACLLIAAASILDVICMRHYERWLRRGAVGREPWIGRWCFER